jgi:hypothetical protein
MTIKIRVGVPHIPFLEILLLFNDQLGAPLVHLDAKRYKAKAKEWVPDTKLAYITSRFVYVSQLSDLKYAEDRISASRSPHVLLLGGSAVDLHQHRVPVYPRLHLTRGDVLYLNDIESPQDLLYTNLERQVDLAREVYDTLAQPSILQMVHTLFYRIQDKEQRKACQATTYRYLSGQLARPPVSGVAKLDNIMRGPEAVRLRASIIASVALSKDQQEDLDYDVRYVLAKVGKLS